MAWEIEVTDQFRQWYDNLSEREQNDITSAVDLLAVEGVRLSRP